MIVVAWPTFDGNEEVKGSKGELPIVGRGSTRADGSFTILQDSKVNLLGYASKESASVNLEVFAVQGNAPSQGFSFVREVDEEGTTTEVHGETGVEVASPGLVVEEVPAVDRATSTLGIVRAPMDFVEGNLFYTWEADYAPAWDLVGQLYISTTGATGTFTYTTGSSSTLGVGVSNSGMFGSFNASGTSTKSSTTTIGFPTVTSNQGRYFDTQFRYSRFGVSYCWPPGCTVFQHSARATAFIGGTRTRSVTAPSATYCTSYQAGSSFTKESSTAVTWSNGFEGAGIIGINLSSRTGYTSQAKVYFYFSSTRQLCGTSGYPTLTPRQLVVKA